MYLNYKFEIMCDVLYSAADHVDNGWYEPTYRKELRDVDYEYEVDVSFNDFLDFIKPAEFKAWSDESKNAYVKAIRDVFDADWFDIEDLEENEEFIEFMQDKYADKALEACEEAHC